MKKFFLFSLVLLLTGVVAFASNPALLFLSAPIGASAAGLGGAYTARADGVQAIYWNPAGMYNPDKTNEVMFFHNSYIEDLSHTYLGYVRNIEEIKGTLGLSLNMFDHGSFDRTTLGSSPADYNKDLGTFDANDFAFGLSYRPITDYAVQFGVGLNFFKSSIADADATGFAVDFGWRYDDSYNDIPYRAALSIKNVGGNVTYDRQKEKLPLTIKTGLTLDYSISDQFVLSPAMDIYYDQQVKDGYVMFGVEGTYQNMFSLRVGYDGMVDAGSNISFGFGINYADFGFNYAFKDFGDLDSAHLLELLYKF